MSKNKDYGTCPECGGKLVYRGPSYSVISREDGHGEVITKHYDPFIGCSNYYKKGCKNILEI